jgi:hypothetical protein
VGAAEECGAGEQGVAAGGEDVECVDAHVSFWGFLVEGRLDGRGEAGAEVGLWGSRSGFVLEVLCERDARHQGVLCFLFW